MSDCRILIIDDSMLSRMAIRKLLHGIKADIVEAENGLEAIELVSGIEFNLIITDVNMPEMNGFDLCRCLKTKESTQNIPVVIVSSHESDIYIDQGFEAGAAAYVSKHDAPMHLYTTVDKILSKSARNQEQLILIVDDSPLIRKMVEAGLKNAGFQTMIAENGSKGLKMLSLQEPSLILSDIEMPIMNGFQFCKAVHANPEFSHIPFVTMSTRSERSYMNRMLHNGAEAYITKPFNIDQLVRDASRRECRAERCSHGWPAPQAARTNRWS